MCERGGGGGGRQGFMDQGFWTKLGMDYGFLTSSPLDCGFEMVSGQWIGSYFCVGSRILSLRIMDFGFISFV